MKRLIAVLAVLLFFASSFIPAIADEGIDTKKKSQPTINYTWGSGTNSTLPVKKNVKAIKGQNIKNVRKGCDKKPCDYIK